MRLASLHIGRTSIAAFHLERPTVRGPSSAPQPSAPPREESAIRSAACEMLINWLSASKNSYIGIPCKVAEDVSSRFTRWAVSLLVRQMIDRRVVRLNLSLTKALILVRRIRL